MSAQAQPKPDAESLNRLFATAPPHSLESEMACLGSMLQDPNRIGEVSEFLTGPDDFYKPAHTVVYGVLCALYDEATNPKDIDLIGIKNALANSGSLEQIGGVEYLVECAESVPSAASAQFYAQHVRDYATKRRLIDVLGHELYHAYTSGDEARDIVDHAESALMTIADKQTQGNESASLAEVLDETYRMLEAREGKMYTGLETGFRDIDDITGGLQAGEMIVLAARPSIGKTALLMGFAEHIAANHKQPVGIFSLEMSREQLGQRMLCSCAGVDSHRMRRNMLSGDDFQSLSIAVSELSEAPIYIDDDSGLTVGQLRARARRMVQKFDIKMVGVDYMQLMTAGRAESRQQEVSEISRGIKTLARQLEIPVVALSQLNRKAADRSDNKPKISDLRESGSIEQDADVVMLLHREEYYHSDDKDWAAENPERVGLAEVNIAKQRNGPVGMIGLQFESKTTRFHDRARGLHG